MQIIKKNKLSQREMFLLVLTAIFLAFSIDLISGFLFNLNVNKIYLLGFGIGILLLVLFILIYLIYSKFNRIIIFHGFFIYDSKNNKILEVKNYELSEEICEKLKYAFSESRKLKTIWDKYPLRESLNSEYGGKITSMQLINELFEYIVLEKFSVHLTDYFNERNKISSNTSVIKRRDIPKIIETNNFLNLFSRPINERSIFSSDKKKEKGSFSEDNLGEPVMVFGKGYFSKFDLVLPKNSKVERIGKNSIKIESSKLRLILKTDFSGYGTNLPYDFEKLYIGKKNFKDLHTYELDLIINLKFKFKTIFTIKGWEYYEWIDELMALFNKDFSKDYFFTKINWENLSAMMNILRNKEKIKSKKKKRTP